MLDHLTDEQNSTLTRVADEYLAALTRPDPYDDAVVAAVSITIAAAAVMA